MTSDGGQKWDTIFGCNTSEYEINAKAFPSKERIVWVGDTTEYQRRVGLNAIYRRSGVFCTSTDAGQSWNKVQIDTNTMLDYVVMLDENTGLINQRRFTNMYNKNISFWDTLYYTEDFFKTYTTIQVPEISNFVNKIFMFSKDNFIIKTSNYSQKKYKYFETTDKGITWTEFADAELIADLYFINRQIAYKIENRPKIDTNRNESKIYKTTNGGSDWIHCFTPSDVQWQLSYKVFSIAAADADNSIAIGTYGALFRTQDGGISWHKEYAPNISDSFDMEFKDFGYITYPEKNCAYITGAGTVFKMNGEKILSRPLLYIYSNRISPIGVKAFWKSVEGAKKYKIQMASAPLDNIYDYKAFENLIFDTIVTDTSIVLPDFDFNKCYYGRIKSISDDMESEWHITSNMFCTFQNADYTDPPIFISPLPGEIINSKHCEFRWYSVVGADEYQLQVSDNDYYIGDVGNHQASKDTFFISEDLIPETKYYARLRVISGSKITNWTTTYFKISNLSSIININFDNSKVISVYPNPASDFITITFSNKELKLFASENKVQIFDVLGIEVMTELIHPMTSIHPMT